MDWLTPYLDSAHWSFTLGPMILAEAESRSRRRLEMQDLDRLVVCSERTLFSMVLTKHAGVIGISS